MPENGQICRHIVVTISMPEPHVNEIYVEIPGVPAMPGSGSRTFYDGNRHAAVRRAIACVLHEIGASVIVKDVKPVIGLGEFVEGDTFSVDFEFETIKQKTPERKRKR